MITLNTRAQVIMVDTSLTAIPDRTAVVESERKQTAGQENLCFQATDQGYFTFTINGRRLCVPQYNQVVWGRRAITLWQSDAASGTPAEIYYSPRTRMITVKSQDRDDGQLFTFVDLEQPKRTLTHSNF